MSLKSFFSQKKILAITTFVVFVIVFFITQASRIKKTTFQITEPIIPPTTTKTTADNESEVERFLKEYQFMFWQLPNSLKSSAVGWMNDTPIIIKNHQIFNPYTNLPIKDLTSQETALLNNNGEALVTTSDQQKVLNLSNLTERVIDQKERDSFSFVWYNQPNTIVTVSADKKTISLVTLSNNQQSVIAQTNNQFNPLSISSNNQTVAFTDSDFLYLFYNKQLNKIKLDNTTKESITFWLNNELYLVEKVSQPRTLDFIMLVDIKDQELKQIITSSSQINRLNLKIKPAINQKNDMILFSENNGLVWILSRNQAITRIYPQLKLPPEAWTNSAP